MQKDYLVMHTARLDYEKIEALSSKKERLDFMATEHGILKQQIKDKLIALSNLDPEYKVISDDMVIVPAILISCNEEMRNALLSDTDLSVSENEAIFTIC